MGTAEVALTVIGLFVLGLGVAKLVVWLLIELMGPE